MTMTNPPHPGRSIRENCLEPLGLNVTDAAKVLGVARHTLSRVLNGHAAVSPEMAIRLEEAGWSNAEFWLRRQGTYDLMPARKRKTYDVSRSRPPDSSQGEESRERFSRFHAILLARRQVLVDRALELASDAVQIGRLERRDGIGAAVDDPAV